MAGTGLLSGGFQFGSALPGLATPMARDHPTQVPVFPPLQREPLFPGRRQHHRMCLSPTPCQEVAHSDQHHDVEEEDGEAC